MGVLLYMYVMCVTVMCVQKVEPWMEQFLDDLRQKHTIGFVGGSNLEKQVEQLGENS